jgi:radical SAM protein with 4Fe4S-binding SPASM domain
MAFGSAELYQFARRMYSEIPYRFRDGRHAFAPFQFYLEVTRRCNLRCVMCPYLEFLTELPRAEQAEGELTTDEWKGVLDQIRRFSLITFTGGEPWIRRDFQELYEHACRRHLVHTITNGTLLRDATIERIVELAPRRFPRNGPFFIGISLDGVGDVHDKIRAQDGAYERSLKAVRALAEARRAAEKKFPLIHVTAVVQDANLDVLPTMPGVLHDLGVDIFNLTLENRSLDEIYDSEPIDFGFDKIKPPRIDAGRLREALAATRRAADEAGIALRMPRIPDEEIVNYYSGGLELNKFTCRAPWTMLSIDYKGNVSPCYLELVGNVREQSLKEIWRGAKMQSFRRGCKESLWPACQGCCEMEHREGESSGEERLLSIGAKDDENAEPARPTDGESGAAARTTS